MTCMYSTTARRDNSKKSFQDCHLLNTYMGGKKKPSFLSSNDIGLSSIWESAQWRMFNLLLSVSETHKETWHSCCKDSGSEKQSFLYRSGTCLPAAFHIGSSRPGSLLPCNSWHCLHRCVASVKWPWHATILIWLPFALTFNWREWLPEVQGMGDQANTSSKRAPAG